MIKVYAPSAGQALVSLTGQLWTDFPVSTDDRLENIVKIARCGEPDTVAPPCAARSAYWFHKGCEGDDGDSTFPYSITSQLNFSAAGNRTIYLNANSSAYDAGCGAPRTPTSTSSSRRRTRSRTTRR